MDPVTGYCYVGDPPDGELITMDELRPGDLFRFLPDADPVMSIVLHESTEQAANLFVAMVKRAKLYRYQELDAPSEWGGAGCVAVEAD